MEIEIGLRISKPSNDAFSTNLRITKGGSDPLFLSIETNTMFMLLANLKGYPREKLKIDINEDGTQIAISGEKVVTQVMTVGSLMPKREAEVRRFRKVFRIPDGVVLDGINARFNEQESVLKILMPKSVKGISGVGIEEVKEEEIDRGSHERTGVVADEVPERENHRETLQGKKEEKKDVKATDEVEGRLPQGEPQDIRMARPEEEPTQSIKRKVPPSQETTARKDSDLQAKSRATEATKAEEFVLGPEATESPKVEAHQVTPRAQVEKYDANEENSGVETHLSQQQSNAEIQEAAQVQLQPKQDDQTESLEPDHPEEVQGMENEIRAETDRVEPPEEQVDDRKGSLVPSSKSKLCSPSFLAGSAILVSIIVLVIHFIRPKRR